MISYNSSISLPSQAGQNHLTDSRAPWVFFESHDLHLCLHWTSSHQWHRFHPWRWCKAAIHTIVTRITTIKHNLKPAISKPTSKASFQTLSETRHNHNTQNADVQRIDHSFHPFDRSHTCVSKRVLTWWSRAYPNISLISLALSPIYLSTIALDTTCTSIKPTTNRSPRTMKTTVKPWT